MKHQPRKAAVQDSSVNSVFRLQKVPPEVVEPAEREEWAHRGQDQSVSGHLGQRPRSVPFKTTRTGQMNSKWTENEHKSGETREKRERRCNKVQPMLGRMTLAIELVWILWS